MPNTTMKLLIQGQVQKVGYRHWMQHQALALDLKGYVKNTENGEVESVIFGDATAVHEMLKKCLIGPLRAHVKNINPIELKSSNVIYDDFKIMT